MPHPSLRNLDAAGRLRRLLSDTAVYGVAAALNKLLALVTFPLLARNLSVADYGNVDLLLVLVNWLALLLLLGIDSAVGRLMADPLGESERAQAVSQGLLWLALMALVIVPVMWIRGESLLAHVGVPAQAAALATIVAVQLPLLAVTAVAQAVLRWTFQRRAFVVVSFGSALGYATALVLAFAVWTPTPKLVLTVAVAIQLPVALVALWFIRAWLRWPRSLAAWCTLLPIAVPTAVVSCMAAALPLVERAFVAQGLGADALGLYAAGAKVAALLSLPIVAFQSGWGPYALALHREQDAGRTFNDALLMFTWLMCLAALALSALAPWVVAGLASRRYAEGAVVVLPLALALVVQGVGWILEIGITVSKRMHLSVLAYFALIGTFAVAAGSLAGSLGLFGVALALLAAQVAFAVTLTLLAQRAHRLPWQLGAPVLLLLVTLVAGCGQWLVVRSFGPLAASIVTWFAFMLLLAWGHFHGPTRQAIALLTSRSSRTR